MIDNVRASNKNKKSYSSAEWRQRRRKRKWRTFRLEKPRRHRRPKPQSSDIFRLGWLFRHICGLFLNRRRLGKLHVIVDASYIDIYDQRRRRFWEDEKKWAWQVNEAILSDVDFSTEFWSLFVCLFISRTQALKVLWHLMRSTLQSWKQSEGSYLCGSVNFCPLD